MAEHRSQLVWPKEFAELLGAGNMQRVVQKKLAPLDSSALSQSSADLHHP
jgi:hypothetical protein